MFDAYPLAERGFNFPKMAFFMTKSKTGTKMSMKHFGNISFMAVWMGWVSWDGGV